MNEDIKKRKRGKRVAGSKDKNLTGAERVRNFRAREKEQKTKDWFEAREGKIKSMGYTDVKQFLESSEEDLRNFVPEKGEPTAGFGQPIEYRQDEKNWRKDIGLSEAHMSMNMVKRQAKTKKCTICTFVDLEEGFYEYCCDKNGVCKWNKVDMKEGKEEYSEYKSEHAKYIGAKGK